MGAMPPPPPPPPKKEMFLTTVLKVHVPNFGEVSGSEDRGGGDNSIQFINFGRVGDKSFKEWRQKLGGWKGGSQQDFDFFVPLYSIKNDTFLFI